MPINRPPTESQPRPQKAVDVLRATDSEPESGLMFDPRVDIGEKEQAELFKTLILYRKDSNTKYFADLAICLSVLYPNHKTDLDLNNEKYNEMKENFDNDIPLRQQNSKRVEISPFAYKISLLFPGKRHELGLDDEKFDGMKAELDYLRDIKRWNDFSGTAYRLLVLYPDRKNDMGITEDDFKKMKIELNEFRHLGNWQAFCFMAMRIYILFPDRKDKLELGQTEFDQMKAELEKVSHPKNSWEKMDCWIRYANIAMALTILSADSVEITANSQIKLTYKPKPLIKDRVPLPDRSRV